MSTRPRSCVGKVLLFIGCVFPLTGLFADVSNDVLPIGHVQGTVGNQDDGHKHASPMAKEYVVVQGVIYQTTLRRSQSGRPLHGFFIQNTRASSDEDVHSSDGLFVHTGSQVQIGGEDGLYTPTVGDEVIIKGKVYEHYNQTELQHIYLYRVVRHAVAIDTELATFEANPPSHLDAAARYWERREGMRCRVPKGCIVQGARSVYESTSDAELWMMRGDAEVCERTNPFSHRIFRDAHPLDDIAFELFDNGNGHRILLGSHGIKSRLDHSLALIAPGKTFDRLVTALHGGIYYAYEKYAVQVDTQAELAHSIDPADNARAEERLADAFGVATYNVYNLYDYRDDPFDGCDFKGNSGCPDVRKPLNFVPNDQAAYQRHLQDLAKSIVEDLYAPEILLLQEVEDQDIVRLDGGTLRATEDDPADGKLDALQDLAAEIRRIGGPQYEAACDRDGADYRGIISPFLVRSDRVEIMAVTSNHPVLGNNPHVSYETSGNRHNGHIDNPKAFNAPLPIHVSNYDKHRPPDFVFSRAPQVAYFRVWEKGLGKGASMELYVINNHFSSGPDHRIERRKEQAKYNARIVRALKEDEPKAKILVGGDLNVFPRPDDPHPVEPSDQLAALYMEGLINLHEVVARENPASAYTSVYHGEAGTLDQLFVTSRLFEHLGRVHIPHINADWSKDESTPGGRGASDHDPVVAWFTF